MLLLGWLLASTPGCSSCTRPDSTSARTRVTVSIFPVYDLVRRVAGPDADVSLVVPTGRTGHSYAPTPQDVESARPSKLGVMVGLGLDAWMETMMKDAAPTARVLKVGDRVPTLGASPPIGAAERGGDDQDPAARGAPDPHVWLDPQRSQLIVRAVAEELGRVDRAHAIAYRERANELDRSLVAVDREAEERLRALRRRELVTFHGSFGYFAERYGLTIVAVIEPSPGSPPPTEHVAKVRALIEEKKIPALFAEPQLDPGPAKTLAEEAKIPLGVLDALGGGPETDSYEKMIRFDVAQLEKHLR